MNIGKLNQNVVKQAGVKALVKVLPQLSNQQIEDLEKQILEEQSMLLGLIELEKKRRNER